MSLTPEERALVRPANEALQRLLDEWEAIGLPPAAKAGTLLAAYIEVSMGEGKRSLEEVVSDFVACVNTMLPEEELAS